MDEGRLSATRSRLTSFRAAALLAVAATVAASVGYAAPSDENSASQSCFFLHSWDGQWKVTPDSRSIYVKQNGVVFRLDLEQAIPMLQSSFAVLKTKGTSNAVCRPEDMHFEASDRTGGLQNLIVRKMTRLTAEQVAALPKELRL
jgi:hypothetical protein